ncbi:DUF2157 domain-containing protein [Ferruginibacter sp. HRS2-29]|uniref:DUF2157 domain-containing protein n=1 Tax=Ferruginibacter sp. HRS2-29 TaxID=2487334 RepID=UPI0020CD5778|nr:DUF2157 domain-containing protein [Ferruginibacter sp. HRS2-29]MCP9752083.1 DUF2157 domain-containing protein [Ferruginibacter sp. HRS2-29]
MNIPLFEKLHSGGQLSDASFQKIKVADNNRLFSLYWELRTILYLGILLLSGGLGILVYKNIDTIGHQVILAFIAAVCMSSFVYAHKKKPAYTNNKAISPNSFFDYIVLLGCLTMVTFIGYLQFQYNVFGTKYGLAAFIPMVLLFAAAYYFDHLGVLSMAITALAAWAGFAVTPSTILQDNDFNSETILLTGALLGILLVVAGLVSTKRKIKAHFEFTYSNFGANLLFICTLGAMFMYDQVYAAYLLVLTGICFFFYKKALRDRSFYFLLILTLYFYTGLTYTIIRGLFEMSSDIGGVYLACFYFIFSAIALIIFLVKMNKKIKAS